MSQDLPAYLTMKASAQSLNFDDQYISQHDEAELARLKNMSSGQGLGQILNVEDEELSGMLSDFGFQVEQE